MQYFTRLTHVLIAGMGLTMAVPVLAAGTDAGLSVGHSIFANTWLSVGYNVRGFEDGDFTAADYTAQGPYMKFRMKLDQGLVDRFVGFVGAGRR